MPQLLYIICNSPVWLPFKYFHKFQALFRDLVWKKGVPRIKYEMLQHPKDEGGLAVPNPWLYFLASQLQYLKGWDVAESTDPAHKLLHFLAKGRGLLPALEAGFPIQGGSPLPTIKLYVKVWDRAKLLLNISGCTPFTPLWHNPKLQGFSQWESAGITLISHLQSDGTFKSFHQLREEFGLSPRVFYQFLQIRHAWNSQFCITTLKLTKSSLISIISGPGGKSGLMSFLYQQLLAEFLKKYPLTVKSKWESDVGNIGEEQWETILSTIPLLSTNESLCVSQLYLIHRVYRTPAFLQKVGLRVDAKCPRCGLDPADLMHMFWNCVPLSQFWGALISYLNQIFHVTLPHSPLLCVLGWIEDTLGDEYLRLAIQRLLYQARKLIATPWLSRTVPTQREFLDRVNHVIRMERGVYLKRGAISKFEKIWGIWNETHGLSFTSPRPASALIPLPP